MSGEMESKREDHNSLFSLPLSFASRVSRASKPPHAPFSSANGIEASTKTLPGVQPTTFPTLLPNRESDGMPSHRMMHIVARYPEYVRPVRRILGEEWRLTIDLALPQMTFDPNSPKGSQQRPLSQVTLRGFKNTFEATPKTYPRGRSRSIYL